MRTSIFLYALLPLLASCAKDKGSPAASTSGQTATSNCPTLNGTYAGNDKDGSALSFTFTTIRDGALTSYTFAEGSTAGTTPLPADGSVLNSKANDGTPVQLSLSCGAYSLIMSSRNGNQPPVTLTCTDLGGGRIRAEFENQTTVLTKQ